MRKAYDFSNSKKNPYGAMLKIRAAGDRKETVRSRKRSLRNDAKKRGDAENT